MVDVSVITAVWNGEHTILPAIISALSQSGVSVEVIVADDASTDATGAVVAGLNDPRVRYLRLPVNGGPAAARNAAIEVAQGKWIAVLDADDRLIEGRLASLISIASEHCLEIVTDNMVIQDAKGTRRLFIEEELDGEILLRFLADYINSNKLFGPSPSEGYLKPVFAADFLRRHALRYDTATRIGEDFLLVAEAMALGARYGRVRSAGYIYTTNSGSISHRLTARNVNQMVAADQRYLSRYGARLDASERAAWLAHLKALEDGANFVAMVESIKARDFVAFARSAWRRPTAFKHFSMPIRARIERLARRHAIDGAPT
ncbi:MAG TPA: glycosyltransferase family 2 protein [Rhodopila sp.]|jgi:succinoglycan biosynthesis protein ExoO|nr:glycosyltransferase family 2 protein [Rhodopila sp.]